MVEAINIGNVFEFNHRHLWVNGEHPSTPQMRGPVSASAESAVYWNPTASEFAIVTARALPKIFLDYVQSRLKIRVHPIVPAIHSGSLCFDLLQDNDACDSLMELAKHSLLYPWGLTADLMSVMSGLNCESDFGGVSPNLVSLVDHLDTKIGSRDFLSLLSSVVGMFRIPRGFVVTRDERLIEPLVHLIEKINKGIVLKANRGWGGRANLLVGDTTLAEPATLTKIRNFLETLDSTDDVIFEELIGSIAKQITPSLDVYIAQNGSAVSIWPNNMITDKGECRGVCAGVGALSSDLSESLKSIGLKASELLRATGFRGWFDIDFILGDKELVASEINVRRTGGTAPIMIMERFFGQNWMHHKYVKTIERIPLTTPVEFGLVLDVIDRLQGRYNESRTGVLPLTASGSLFSQPYAAVIMYGDNPQQVDEIEIELRTQLAKVVNGSKRNIPSCPPAGDP